LKTVDLITPQAVMGRGNGSTGKGNAFYSRKPQFKVWTNFFASCYLYCEENIGGKMLRVAYLTLASFLFNSFSCYHQQLLK